MINKKGMVIIVKDDIEKVLLSESRIKEKVKELAGCISRDYKDKTPMIISVLKGSFIFMADLVRHLDIPCTLDFMAVSSYGAGTKTSGAVQIIKDLEVDIAGKHVVLVEDILDSGVTLSYIMGLMEARGAASISICTLLNKPARRKVPVEVAYSGFDIPDEFVVGYGLDFAEKYRNLPYIGVLKPSIYKKTID